MIIPKADILNKGMGASASANNHFFVILKHIKNYRIENKLC